jgi:hypothetical protein
MRRPRKKRRRRDQSDWSEAQLDIAPDAELERNGVGVGDVFLFFGLFAWLDGRDRHHRIFGYMEIDEVRRLGGRPSKSDNPKGFLRRHPHTVGEWNENNMTPSRPLVTFDHFLYYGEKGA